MARDLQIVQAQRESGGPLRDRKPQGGQRCIWCDAVEHNWRDCADFAEAIRGNVVYLWNGRVHASDTQRPAETNFGHGGMKRLVQEAAARHADVVHYSPSAGIRVGGSEDRKTKDLDLCYTLVVFRVSSILRFKIYVGPSIPFPCYHITTHL